MLTSNSSTRILVVDDQPHVRDLLSRWLEEEGYSCQSAADVEEALQLLRQEEKFSLVISDIMMEGKSGIDLLSWISRQQPDVAVIMATGVDDRRVAIDCLKRGAYGYVTKPFDEDEILIAVAGALERQQMVQASRHYQQYLEKEVRERTADLRAREKELALRLVAAAESRDKMTGAHIQRIGLYSAALAKAWGWEADRVDEIQLAATMHDLGKIGIPDGILLKPDKLTDEEFEVIKLHTKMGAQILEGSEIPLLRLAQEIARCHHEKWDGTGYPGGLAGEEIPESARMVAIVDAYDALTEPRPYSRERSVEEAVSIMREAAGRHFDPRLFECFVGILPEMWKIREAVAEGALVVWAHTEEGPGSSELGLVIE